MLLKSEAFTVRNPEKTRLSLGSGIMQGGILLQAISCLLVIVFMLLLLQLLSYIVVTAAAIVINDFFRRKEKEVECKNIGLVHGTCLQVLQRNEIIMKRDEPINLQNEGRVENLLTRKATTCKW